jgi:hypothetical protein
VHNIQQTGMLIAGGAVLGVSYGVTFLYGYTAQIESSVRCSLGDTECDRKYWPILIPIVGPFIGFATTKPSGAGVGALLVSGITQIAGAGLFIGGLALEEKMLIRKDRRWGVVPLFDLTPGGPRGRSLQASHAGAALVGTLW